MHMRRTTAVMLAALMMVLGALPGLAREATTDTRGAGDRVAVDVVDRPLDRSVDVRLVDQVPADVVDRPVDRVRDRETDRERDREIDRVRDRETDRCVDFVNDRRCIDDRHPHLNVRHLIQRLIHAGEWEKVFRLLHRLGII